MSETNAENQGTPLPWSLASFMRLINKIPPIVSFASLLLGVILAATSIIRSNLEADKLKVEADKLKVEAKKLNLESERIRVEVEKLKKELFDSDVKFSVQYIDLKSLAFNEISNHKKQENSANYTFQYFPILKNNILKNAPSLDGQEKKFPVNILPNEMRKGFPHSVSVWKPVSSSVVMLVIQQVGKRRARDVRIEANYVNLGKNRAIELYATSDLNLEDWIKKLGGQHTSIQLGDLNTGDGILVPLFVTYMFNIASNELCCQVLMNELYIPLKITYSDEFDGKKKEINIRPMLESGIEVSADMEIRG